MYPAPSFPTRRVSSVTTVRAGQTKRDSQSPPVPLPRTFAVLRSDSGLARPRGGVPQFWCNFNLGFSQILMLNSSYQLRFRSAHQFVDSESPRTWEEGIGTDQNSQAQRPCLLSQTGRTGVSSECSPATAPGPPAQDSAVSSETSRTKLAQATRFSVSKKTLQGSSRASWSPKGPQLESCYLPGASEASSGAMKTG